MICASARSSASAAAAGTNPARSPADRPAFDRRRRQAPSARRLRSANSSRKRTSGLSQVPQSASECSRSGCATANACPMMPPVEWPTRWTFFGSRMIQQRENVVRPLQHRIRRRAFASPDAAMIERQHPERRAEAPQPARSRRRAMPPSPDTNTTGVALPCDVIGDAPARDLDATACQPARLSRGFGGRLAVRLLRAVGRHEILRDGMEFIPGRVEEIVVAHGKGRTRRTASRRTWRGSRDRSRSDPRRA